MNQPRPRTSAVAPVLAIALLAFTALGPSPCPPVGAALAAVGPRDVSSGQSDRLRETDADGREAFSRVRTAPTPIVPRFDLLNAPRPGKDAFVPTGVAPTGDTPHAVAITRDGEVALVVNRDSDQMIFVDLRRVEILEVVPVGRMPVDVVVTHDGRYALSVNAGSNTLTVVDVLRRRVFRDVPITGSQPYAIELTRDGRHAVVGVINNGYDASFSIIELGTFREAEHFRTVPQGVRATVTTPALAIGLDLLTPFAVTPDGSTIVLPDRAGGVVAIYDRFSGDERLVRVHDAPSALELFPDGSLAVVVHDGARPSISIVDLGTGKSLRNVVVQAPLNGERARITPDCNSVIATTEHGVVFIDLENGAVTAAIPVEAAVDIAFLHDGRHAVVTGTDLRVIDIGRQVVVEVLPSGHVADAASSPVENLVVVLNNRFREELQVYEIAAGGSKLRGFIRSGVAPEADAPKEIAISPGGRLAMVSNAVSRNVSFVDLAQNPPRLLGVVETGDLPCESAFTPDGAHAIVLNRSSDSTSIIDVRTLAVVATLATPHRPARIRVSPDGREAYIATIGGRDTLTILTLDGARSRVDWSRAIGDMGISNEYPYGEVSGIELSPDGRLLAMTLSAQNTLRIFDTATRRVVADVRVGTFPIRAMFSPSGDEIYVASAVGDSVSVMRHRDGAWFEDDRIGGLELPLDMALDHSGTHLFVGVCDPRRPQMCVIDLSAGEVVGAIPLRGVPREGEFIAERRTYVFTTSDGAVHLLESAGPESTIIESIPIAGSAPDMRYVGGLDLIVTSFPGVPDGVHVVALPPPPPPPLKHPAEVTSTP